MLNLVRIEKQLIKKWLYSKQGKIITENCSEYDLKIIKQFIDFFKMYDVFENTNHTEIIFCVYFNCNHNKKISKEKQAKKLNIDVRTLFKYRKKYIDFFLELQNKIGSNHSDF